jgi:hypothetical protein
LNVVAHRKLAILRRRLFTILSILSLLLCLATLALWVRFRGDRVNRRTGDHFWALISANGHFIVHVTPPGEYQWPSSGLWHISTGEPPVPANAFAINRARYRFLGFAYMPNEIIRSYPANVMVGNRHGPFNVYSGTAMFVSHWFLALLFAIVPALHLCSIIRSRRHGPGLCPKCGYDLRATPDRCPECGTSVPSKTVSA